MAGVASLVQTGTKVWLDSIDPQLIARYRPMGISGATSNPLIIAELIETGRFDNHLMELMEKGHDDGSVAWALTDHMVKEAQKAFSPVWDATHGDNGYVSFELDPLLEDPLRNLALDRRTQAYIELGLQWSAGHTNRMIKVPATPAGIAALEELAFRGVTLNVTLIFSPRQYRAAREAVWRGAQRRSSLDRFKSVYSIFISRLDVYTQKHLPHLSAAAQGLVGIVNAKRLWQDNQEFWKAHPTPLKQEIIFASTGTKTASDPPDKYVEALAGSDIQTNPPATLAAVESSGKTYRRTVPQMPAPAVLAEIDRQVDMVKLEQALLEEGVAKFADPHKALLELVARKRQTLTAAQ